MQIIITPTRAFQMSVTSRAIRFLFHDTHPILDDINLGCYPYFHKAHTRPHIELVNKALAHSRGVVLNKGRAAPPHLTSSEWRCPRLTPEGFYELTFDTLNREELRRITPFYHTLSDADAQRVTPGLWLLALPACRRHR